MAGDIRVYDLDGIGVIVDTSPIGNPDGTLTKAQNAVANPIGEQGVIRKRPGLKKFTTSAGDGVVQGGIGIPINLGSAGPNVQNPYDDIDVTLAQLLVPIYTITTVKIGATFDDDSFEFPFDWNLDFAEFDDLLDPDLLDLVDEGQRDGGSTFAPLTLIGDTSGHWWLTIRADASDHTDNGTTYTNPRFLPFPIGKLRSSMTGFSVAGGNGTAALAGYPAVALNNVVYYADGNYTTSTDAPPLRAYDGFTDRIVARIPKNTDVSTSNYPTRIISLCAGNGVLFIATQDGGTPAGGDLRGSVYQFKPTTGELKKLGDTFDADQLPYSLLYAYGRLWCGTASNAGSAKVLYFRPGIDTSWTTDHTFGTDEAAVGGMAIFQGQIYLGILNRALSGTATLVLRSALGAYSNSDTGTIDTSSGHVAWRGYHTVVVWPPEDQGIKSGAPTPALYAIRQGCTEDTWPNVAIRQGLSWTTVYTDGTGLFRFALSPALDDADTLVPVLWAGAGTQLANTVDGSTWADRSSELSGVTGTTFPLPGLVLQV